MNISEALKKVGWDRAEYFKYKFPEVKFDKSVPQKTEEEFLRSVSKKTMNPFYSREKTAEYKALVSIMLQSRVADDLQDIYGAVSENARTGDDRAVKLFLQLTKEIDNLAKSAQAVVDSEKEDEDEDDDLIL